MTLRIVRVLFFLLLSSSPLLAATRVGIAPIPDEVRTDYFVVTINGRATPVVHAASSYYLLNFDLDGPATVSIRAVDAHYWDRGVEIQPMRYGIRPVRRGATITFRIPGPVKLSVARPGDHFADAEMLFLLGSPPDESHITAKTAGIRYYAPGVHREDIEAQTGDHIYLAPGAVVFGSLNLWQVHNVRVEGRGMIIYVGPQEPAGDEGWMQKKAWHCIVMNETQNVEIDGITCVVRSRTWQVQMRDSRATGFYNVNIIGGFPRDANQDGMDWLGGGDTTVRNAFIRASDDDFAMEGNWDGYTDAEMRLPGHDVTNVTVEDSVASTSISNTVRVAWPKKTFRSAHVVMRNLDVIHTGFGGCVVPFSFFELWADDAAQGEHSDFQFSNIRLEDFYSLLQIRYPEPTVRGVVFSNIAAMDGVGMVPSVLNGNISGVVLDGVRVTGKIASGNADIPLEVSGGAAEPIYQPGLVDASFDYTAGLIRPGQAITFRVVAPAMDWHYQWLFGDGSRAQGTIARHAFSDVQGTLLDGSGRFRVLLHATRAPHDEVWASRGVMVAATARAADAEPAASLPGLAATATGNGRGTTFDGWLRIPADGGYSLTLLTSRRAMLTVDDLPPMRSPELRIQVCGSMGDAVQPVRLSAALMAGLHRIRIDLDPGIENEPDGNVSSGGPMLVWEGPGILPVPVPVSAFTHANTSDP
ncbi:MAG TPA: hypothetical protein VHZ25_14410 [Acidobacteriaceae bacterium]|jgi:hypothetical protein|nr:hypothetical protein [Acidobacteriaceae bacterium]